MEFVSKRKIPVQMVETSSKKIELSEFEFEIPVEVLALLAQKEAVAEVALVNLSTIPAEDRHRCLTELETRRLLPSQIRTQVHESAARKNTTRQMTSIVFFLFDHQSAVLLGEKLPPLHSPFCRVPFSNVN